MECNPIFFLEIVECIPFVFVIDRISVAYDLAPENNFWALRFFPAFSCR